LQHPPKPQFANWLIEQVETGQYPGLSFVDHNKFRVPWKHNSRKDCNDGDSKIFRAWAVASGKINEFPNDKARWKTNFRCALNNLSTRFKMIKDNSKTNNEDPHKIYEIINTENMAPDIITPTEYFPSGSEVCYCLEHTFTSLSVKYWSDYDMFFCLWYFTELLSGMIWVCKLYANVFVTVNPPQFITQPLQPTIFDLEISIHYRKKEMLKTTLHTPRLQLHYYHEAPELNAEHLCFPSTESLLDHKQIEYTNRILNSIQKGLLLEVRETGIYAFRQDRCHVFASTSDPVVAHPDPRKLPQNTTVELLSFEKYVNELKQFRENNGGSPEYTINMCFGEKFPDGKPLEKKLIVVKVVPLICRHFHELAQMEGASSLHSANVSLQISHNSLYDLISSVFGLPMVHLFGQI
uniref:Interferon regulatory factor 7 n=1 Tax=Sphaeramia orbicularis TaxID=375764 RepID=A0A673BM15_9TELE